LEQRLFETKLDSTLS